MVRKLSRGFFAPFRGLVFLKRERTLWKYVVIPLVINVLVFVGLGILFFFLFPELVGLILPEGDAWYWTIVRAVLWVIGSFLVAVLFLVSFTAVGTAIASPFNEALSEQVERMVGGWKSEDGEGLWGQAKRSARSAIESMKHVAVYLGGSLIIGLTGLIPAAGTLISMVLGTLWTFLFLAMEFGDYYLERHWLAFRTRWRMVLAERWSSLGFGAGCAALFMIPFLNLLLMPGAVVGGTLLWMELKPPNRDLPSATSDLNLSGTA